MFGAFGKKHENLKILIWVPFTCAQLEWVEGVVVKLDKEQPTKTMYLVVDMSMYFIGLKFYSP